MGLKPPLCRLEVELLVIDEAPTIAPHLLLCYMTTAAEVVLLGDPRQIPAIDFESKGLIPAMQLNLEPTEWRLQSHMWGHNKKTPGSPLGLELVRRNNHQVAIFTPDTN